MSKLQHICPHCKKEIPPHFVQQGSMIKTIITTILLAIVTGTQSGCLSILSSSKSDILVDNAGKVIAGRNRYDAYVGGKEEDAKAMGHLSVVMKVPTVETIVTFDDKNKPVFTNKINFNGLFIAADLEKIQENQSKASVPKSSFAEAIDSAGNFVTRAAGAPASIILGTGYAMGMGLRHAGDRSVEYHGDLKDSNNSQKFTTIGDRNYQPPLETEETIYDPEPLTK